MPESVESQFAIQSPEVWTQKQKVIFFVVVALKNTAGMKRLPETDPAVILSVDVSRMAFVMR
jgi:hypothetical protein